MFNPILEAVELLGGYEATGQVCGVTGKAIMKWVKQGHLPRTEWTGETTYASAIERATKRHMTRKKLLAVRPPPKLRLAIQQSKPQHPLRRKTDKPLRGRRKKRAEASA